MTIFLKVKFTKTILFDESSNLFFDRLLNHDESATDRISFVQFLRYV